MQDDSLEHKTLIALTSDIIAAHVINNDVDAGGLPLLITNIYGALAALGQSSSQAEVRPQPADSIRASVKPDHIVCLEYGKKMKMLKRHLSTAHDTRPEDYRKRWNLPNDYPLVGPNHFVKRRELANKIPLGRKPGKRVTRRKNLAASAKADKISAVTGPSLVTQACKSLLIEGINLVIHGTAVRRHTHRPSTPSCPTSEHLA